MVDRDPRIRIQAYLKRTEVVAYACGRGEALANAAVAYSEFLSELAANNAGKEKLKDLLEVAEEKLNVAFEEARKFEKGMMR